MEIIFKSNSSDKFATANPSGGGRFAFRTPWKAADTATGTVPLRWKK
jgi:hypothetical protein